MKIVLSIGFTIIFSYLLGSLNSAIIVCKICKKKDIRNYGSGNAGLTNVLRVFGKGPALATLLCDLAKGVAAVLLCRLIVGNILDVQLFNDDKFIGYIAGFFVMLGHIFPIFYGFHGGKGVLIAASTLLAIDPLTCLFTLVVFTVVVSITKYVSLGSISSAVSYPLFTFINQQFIYNNQQGVLANTLAALLIGALIVYMHKPNIKRLLDGNENKFQLKK